MSFCVVDVANQMLRCADPEKVPFDKPIADADNWGCMSPQDWEVLLKGVQKNPALKQASKNAKEQLRSNPTIAAKWSTILTKEN